MKAEDRRSPTSSLLSRMKQAASSELRLSLPPRIWKHRFFLLLFWLRPLRRIAPAAFEAPGPQGSNQTLRVWTVPLHYMLNLKAFLVLKFLLGLGKDICGPFLKVRELLSGVGVEAKCWPAWV